MKEDPKSVTVGVGSAAVEVKEDRHGNIELRQNGSMGRQLIHIQAADSGHFRQVVKRTG